MSEAGSHAFAILKNIQVAAGVRPGAYKQPQINKNAGINALAVSLGNKRGAMYATDPNLEAFFATKDKLAEEVGPMKDAGKKGWLELSPGVDYLKFVMVPPGFKNAVINNDTSLFDQFYGEDHIYKVEDA